MSDARDAFEDQEDYDEIVEIGEDGNVYKPGQAPKFLGSKPSILRDPVYNTPQKLDRGIRWMLACQ
ncbi:hypothetical protein LCGC14_2121130 [marine sediment metagenome]|uniref:Uncharacterized protein n=1 Tax=marine sediment metagenome TaxID=412755 RepID=A0A0F9GHC9_9ZZZZ